jgi:hypothetical protein
MEMTGNFLSIPALNITNNIIIDRYVTLNNQIYGRSTFDNTAFYDSNDSSIL